MAQKLNIVFGERYGDVNDPKTRWSRCGALFIKDDADQADVEALFRLVEDKKVNLRIDSTPNSKQFDGWYSIFTPKYDNDGGQPSEPSATEPLAGATDASEAIDPSDIPF